MATPEERIAELEHELKIVTSQRDEYRDFCKRMENALGLGVDSVMAECVQISAQLNSF